MHSPATTFNPLFMRHDLMIELGRLETVLDDARETGRSGESLDRLETHCARLSEALSRLPA